MREAPVTVILRTGLEVSVTQDQGWSIIESGLATWDGDPEHPAMSADDEKVLAGLNQTSSGLVCDFCNWQLNDEEEIWSYPAKDFATDRFHGAVHQSLGAWSACGLCHRMIQRYDRKALTRRSVQAFMATHPELTATREERRQLQARLAKLHERFWRNRTGPPVQLR